MLKNDFKFHLHYLPIITALWFIITFLIVYIVAVLQGHVSPLFPYISFAGTTPPESCIFGFLLSIGGALLFVNIYVQHRYLSLKGDLHTTKFLNNVSYFLGILSCLGIILVGNFQESNVLVVHMLGALFAFGCSTVYCCIQAWITWKSDATLFLKYFRSFLCILLIPSFLNNFIFGSLSMEKFTGTDMMKWKSEDGGYTLYLVATFSEWILAMTLSVFIFSYEYEFKRICFEGIVFTKKDIRYERNMR